MMNCAIVLCVNDLKLCQSFYRDTLELGEPETASSFGCCFELNESTRLFLLLARARYFEHGSSATMWCMETPDLTKLEAQLDAAGYPLEKETFHLGCMEVRRGQDPEGNCFYVRQKQN